MTFFNERNGMSLQAFFYDSQGNPIKGFSQTTVDGTEGQFYMSMQIRTSNTGNTPLTSVRFQETHPDALTQALQTASASTPNLAVGQSNILQWDTKNTCTTDANCGSSEKCVNIQGQGLRCLIDISNFIGSIQFGATIEADYLNLQNQTSTINTVVNLPIVFEQDSATFRTNAQIVSPNPISLDFSLTGTQLATDRDGNGVLEVYTRAGSGLETTYTPSMFITFSPDNKLVFRCFTDRVCVSRTAGLNKDTTQSNVNRDYYSPGGSIPTASAPTEPYRFQNCGVVGQLCQERYSIVVAPPTQQCGNNLIEGNELCDGTDLGGDDCISINQGFDNGTLSCQSGCTAWETSACTTSAGGSNIKFRTTSLIYPTGEAIAFTSTCGQPLTQYGHSGTSGGLSGGCTGSQFNSYCGGTPVLLESNLPGGYNSGGNAPALYQSGSTPGRVCVCDVGSTNTVGKKYETGDADAGDVSGSITSIDPTLEVAC